MIVKRCKPEYLPRRGRGAQRGRLTIDNRQLKISNHLSIITRHSHLSATIGSTFVARRAGT